jgi:hypothetical protein
LRFDSSHFAAGGGDPGHAGAAESLSVPFGNTKQEPANYTILQVACPGLVCFFVLKAFLDIRAGIATRTGR